LKDRQLVKLTTQLSGASGSESQTHNPGQHTLPYLQLIHVDICRYSCDLIVS